LGGEGNTKLPRSRIVPEKKKRNLKRVVTPRQFFSRERGKKGRKRFLPPVGLGGKKGETQGRKNSPLLSGRRRGEDYS